MKWLSIVFTVVSSWCVGRASFEPEPLEDAEIESRKAPARLASQGRTARSCGTGEQSGLCSSLRGWSRTPPSGSPLDLVAVLSPRRGPEICFATRHRDLRGLAV